jgi:hypothetical protein
MDQDSEMRTERLDFGERPIPPPPGGKVPSWSGMASTVVFGAYPWLVPFWVKKRRASKREIMVCVLVVVLATGCSLGSSGSHTKSAVGPTLTGLVRYRGHGITFAYPATWRYHRPGFSTPATEPLIDLGAQPLVNPCRTTGNATLCDLPLNRLRPGGVVVTWTTGGPPAHSRHPGITVRVARPGYCARIGGEETIDARILTHKHQVFRVEACLRAPGIAANERAIRNMLSSARTT